MKLSHSRLLVRSRSWTSGSSLVPLMLSAVATPTWTHTTLHSIPPRFMISGSTILCDIYLESVKPVISSGTDEARERAKAALYHCVETGLRLISPVMPFLSEELWQHLPRLPNHPPSIVVHAYPEPSEYPFNDEQVEADVALAMSVIRTVRSLRSYYELTNKAKTDLYVSVGSENDQRCLTSLIPLIETLASNSKVEILLKSTITPKGIPSGCAHVTISSRCSVDVAFQGVINVERELVKLAGKKEKNKALVAKLLEQEGRRNYEEKVPLPVRIANTERKEALLAEMKSIEAAIAAFSG
ncbi:Anticodon-binding domain protein [Oesophagostomum dentatum]|uniref:valine--tRNA ligase n=1 Tax=Oesophagostomum dentatum TaxID=61180 RepID=A0A0B1TA94_OESDE|nr:Anticodon-binding domain protein [Oesophagostomum dentatum]